MREEIKKYNQKRKGRKVEGMKRRKKNIIKQGNREDALEKQTVGMA